MERQQASAAASAQAAQQASATASTQIESANQIAAQVAAESAVETQIDAFLMKGLELLDAKSYGAAEYQFRRARELDQTNPDALGGHLQAVLGKGERDKALRLANDALPGAVAGRTRAPLDALVDTLQAAALLADGEAGVLRSLHPIRRETLAQIDLHRQQFVSSVLSQAITQLRGVLPAILADAEDDVRDRHEAQLQEQKAQAQLAATVDALLAKLPNNLTLSPEVATYLRTDPVFREGVVSDETSGRGTYQVNVTLADRANDCHPKSPVKDDGSKNTWTGEWGVPLSMVTWQSQNFSCSGKYSSNYSIERSGLNIMGLVALHGGKGANQSCKLSECKTTESQSSVRVDRLRISAPPGEAAPGSRLEIAYSTHSQTGSTASTLDVLLTCTTQDRGTAASFGLPIPGDIVRFACTQRMQVSGAAPSEAAVTMQYSTFLRAQPSALYLTAYSSSNYSWSITQANGSLVETAGQLEVQSAGSMNSISTPKIHSGTATLVRTQ